MKPKQTLLLVINPCAGQRKSQKYLADIIGISGLRFPYIKPFAFNVCLCFLHLVPDEGCKGPDG